MNSQTLAMPQALFPLTGVIPIQGLAGQDFRLNFNVFSAMRQAVRARTPSVPITVMGRADFIHHITLHLPEVSSRIEEDDFGVLHLEMGAMKEATRDAIISYEFHTVRRHFAFISYVFEHADTAMYDAIMISYLDALFMGETTPEYHSARSLLPKNLAEALRKAELRYSLLHPRLFKY